MYRRPCIDAIRFQRPIVRQLLPRKNETDLIDLNPLLLLQCLLHGEDLILGLEVEGLLSAGEGFDEYLVIWWWCWWCVVMLTRGEIMSRMDINCQCGRGEASRQRRRAQREIREICEGQRQ